VSILFRIGGEDGHAFTYNKAVGEAVARLGWGHHAAVHAGCTVRQLPSGWTMCLETIEHQHGTIARLLGRSIVPDLGSVRRAVDSLAGFLRTQILPQQRRTILFMEFFTVTDLAILALALARAPRDQLAVCLLYRMEVHRQPTRHLYRLLNGLLRRQVGAARFILLSDSQPLAKSLTELFGQPLRVMPIPHGAPPAREVVNLPHWVASRPQVVAWWPGRPSADKGLAIMARLIQQADPEARQVQVVAAAGSGLTPMPRGCQVRLIPNELSNADYWGWMMAADLILLPYDLSYAERTSGIFVEALAAGKPAVTTAGTWMAGELLAHGLPELIVDWSQAGMWQRLACLARDAGLRARLEAMQAVYLREHSLEGYAAALQAALAGSII
jgi:glycosyltransferase involved in cell wall biosynthesis